jgi:hypothetical protein
MQRARLKKNEIRVIPRAGYRRKVTFVPEIGLKNIVSDV